MVKYKIPNFITNKNFNNETLKLIKLEGDALDKLSAQYSYQIIIGLFEQNKDLSAIDLSTTEEYDYDEGGRYLNLNINVDVVEKDKDAEHELSQDLYSLCMDVLDDAALSRIEKVGQVVLKRDNLDSYKSFAGVLFDSDEYVTEYFDVLSRDDGNILPTDYITSKNIDYFDKEFIYEELENLQSLDNQIAILSIKKLFNNPELNSLKISAKKDKEGMFSLGCCVGLNNSSLDADAYGKTIHDLLCGVMYPSMFRQLFYANKSVLIKRDNIGGIKELVDILFNDNKNGNDFIVALQRDELDVVITSKEDKFIHKKCKI